MLCMLRMLRMLRYNPSHNITFYIWLQRVGGVLAEHALPEGSLHLHLRQSMSKQYHVDQGRCRDHNTSVFSDIGSLTKANYHNNIQYDSNDDCMQ